MTHPVTAAVLSVAAIAAGLLAARIGMPAGRSIGVDALAVAGLPPTPGSAAERADRAAFDRLPGPGSPAWVRAQGQVLQFGPEVLDEISCAAGRSLAVAPATRRLLASALADLHPIVDAAKRGHARHRPFMVLADGRSCDFRSLGVLGRSTGGTLTWSFPSGHAAQGRLIALVLADVLPERRAALRAWGDSLGDGRIVCRVHWPSDVAAGRRIADALHRQLAVRPDYRADAAAARRELATAPVPWCPAPDRAG